MNTCSAGCPRKAGRQLTDLIVLDRNLYEIDPHDIHGTKVLITMMDGGIPHREDGF